MKQPKKKPQIMSTYSVAQINEENATDLAKRNLPAFRNSTDLHFYTYDDIASDNLDPVNYIGVNITEAQNNDMFLVEWNGTFPVYTKKKKMFPR